MALSTHIITYLLRYKNKEILTYILIDLDIKKLFII